MQPDEDEVAKGNRVARQGREPEASAIGKFRKGPEGADERLRRKRRIEREEADRTQGADREEGSAAPSTDPTGTTVSSSSEALRTAQWIAIGISIVIAGLALALFQFPGGASTGGLAPWIASTGGASLYLVIALLRIRARRR